MQWLTPDQSDSSAAQAVQRVGFDIIRAIVAARRAANPTVRALHQAQTGHDSRTAHHAGGANTMAVLNGRHRPGADGSANGGAQGGDGHGAFFSLRRGQVWHGEMVSSNGESHA